MIYSLTEQEMQESIRYAAIIQSALLPEKQLFSEYFPQSFILFIPRDVVSGDFYWFQKKQNRIIVVAADCTGHGVPGALMSVMGINFLQQIIAVSIPFSNKILNQLREFVMKALRQEGYNPVRKEGMDMAVCVFDLEQEHIEFSGAITHLIYFKDNKLFRIKGDRMPVGASPIVEESFTRHIIPFSEIDSLYIFSDGYPDQFGGEVDKKLKYSGFKKILSEIQHLSGNDQYQALMNIHKKWKGSKDQTDDILVVGINIQSFVK